MLVLGQFGHEHLAFLGVSRAVNEGIYLSTSYQETPVDIDIQQVRIFENQNYDM